MHSSIPHIWIWLLEDPSKITPPVLRQLETADSLVLSVASIWEIAIKTELGKLSMKASPEAVRDEILHAMYASELPIQSTHALDAARLPKLHKDPLIASSSHRLAWNTWSS